MSKEAQTQSGQESTSPTAAEEIQAPTRRSYVSNSGRFPSPQELHEKHKVKFWVRHIHNGNDPQMLQRAKFGDSKWIPIYVTTCRITDWEGKNELGYGEAVCSHKDVPNRSIGHQMAVGRAIKDFMEHLEDHRRMEQIKVPEGV